MRCHVERGYGNLTPCGSTLWVRVKRHAIHHCGSSMHRRLVENILLIVINLCTVSQYSISLRTYHYMTSQGEVCHWSALTWVWRIGQFYILFWILLESGTSYCLSWRYLHWLDIEFVYCVFDTRKLILSKWWEHTAETLGEEFNLAGSIWWGEATTLWVWTMRCIGIVRTMAIFIRLICPRDLWWDVSVLWGQYLHHRHRDLWIIHLILWCAFYRSWEDFGYLYKDDTVSRRLWSTLWIGYYSGRRTSAIQLYLADLHWQCRTEHSILHWSLKLWDVISMWKADLKKERCVLTMFCIQKKVVQIPYVNHFVLEKSVSLWLMSWLFTFGWEPVWFENFWKCFDVFEFT